MLRPRILQALAALSGKPSELSRAQARQVAREAGLTHASGGHIGRQIKAWLSRAWNYHWTPPGTGDPVTDALIYRQNRNVAKRERRARRAA